MPLAALNLYLVAKHEHEMALGQNVDIQLANREYELKRDAYMLNAMRSLLMLPPNNYYKEYTEWHEYISDKKRDSAKEEYDERDVIDMFRGKKKIK